MSKLLIFVKRKWFTC